MAYDWLRQKVVLFGGEGVTGTWEWDGSTWTPFTSSNGLDPSLFFHSTMVYDTAGRRAVLFGRTASSGCDCTSRVRS